jgi:hypothetical protein
MCHADEAQEYAGSKKAHAVANLRKNPTYHLLVQSIIGAKEPGDKAGTYHVSASIESNSCYACHGAEVAVTGSRTVATDAGNIVLPVLGNWPNQGVGRVNPDSSLGSCTACHPRHSFSIEIARKPHTCGQCHVEPDVPAYNVYTESKHGNIMMSKEREWSWDNVPWRAGADFAAPSCAVCHNSLVASPSGDIIAKRTHDFGSRLWVRIFGLIYAHPQPRNGATYKIVNSQKMSLPTTLDGKPAAKFLIGKEEQDKRRESMKTLCNACHAQSWARAHMAQLDSVIDHSDKAVLEATELLANAWELGVADPANPFDDALEHVWIQQWLFYANSIRYSAAMGGPDHASFKNGWWNIAVAREKMKKMLPEKRRRRR